ncbi:MAG: ComF family protein [Reyranella sp.]|uniref:ComF family protein n=1 Tax=Reyranella sp. TaxID=1929291 RepID=UPI00272F0F14|nr:ComF family protein [Reyranella sp.]MDP1964170.1 ComF family protein [Reyranella sp.]MDP2373017.1 ComF family protein [Reyranella sp.]
MSLTDLGQLCTNAGRLMLDAVLPPLCLGCGEIVGASGALCTACWQGFSFIAAPQCACCGDPFAEHLGDAALCVACLARPPKFRRARAALAYDTQSRRLVLPFKHGDRTDIARACGGWMARAGAELLAEADLIAPVPLHWRRLLTRRYNQALLLARALVRAAPPGVEHRLAPDLLRRHRWTGSQAGLRAKERRSNVRQAFEIHPSWAAEVAGKTVLLVDDVLTTGATAEACTRVLQRGGARHVDVLTLARVVRPAV